MNCQYILQPGCDSESDRWRQRQDRCLLSEDRQLGRQVPILGLIDDQHRMGAGIDGGTDLDEVRRHGVGVAPGASTSPGRLSPSRLTDRAEDIGPFGALVLKGARGFRVPRRRRHRRVSLFFWPMRASSCHHSSISTPFEEPRPDLRQFGGEVFFKSLDGQLVLRDQWRGQQAECIGGEAERLQLAPLTVVSSSEMAIRLRRATAFRGPCAAQRTTPSTAGDSGRPQQPPPAARR